MANKKLQEIGNELGVSRKDMARIRRQRLKGRLLHPLHPLTAVIIVACCSGFGFWAGKAELLSTGGYPYAATGLALTTGPKISRGGRIMITVLLSLLGFVVAYRASYNMYHEQTLYNVFSRQK